MAKKLSIFTLTPLLLVIVIDTMGMALIIPIVSPLFMAKTGGILPPTTSIGIREFFYGLTIAGFTLCMILGSPFLGDLSDYLGRKKVLIISLLGTAISYAVAGFGVVFHSVTWLIIGRCVAGFASGSQPVAQAAIADISSPEDKAVNMGLLAFASCIGFIVGPLIGGYFANPKWFGYATPFFIACLLAAGNSLGVAYGFKETFVPTKIKKLQFAKGFMVFLSAFTHKKITPIMLILLFAQTGAALYFCYVSIFLVQVYGYSTIGIGHFMTFFGVIMAFNYLVVVRYSVKFFNLKNIVMMSLIMTGLGILILLWHTHWIVWLSVLPIAIGNGLFYTSILTLLSNMTDKDSQGWIMGAFSAVSAASWTFGGLLPVLGALHIYLPYIVAVALIAISILMFSYLLYAEAI